MKKPNENETVVNKVKQAFNLKNVDSNTNFEEEIRKKTEEENEKLLQELDKKLGSDILKSSDSKDYATFKNDLSVQLKKLAEENKDYKVLLQALNKETGGQFDTANIEDALKRL